jgi:hypothetical protein
MSPTSYRTAPPRVKIKPNTQHHPQFHPSIRSGTLLQIRNRKSEIRNLLVGLGRVELPTSRLSGVRSNQLSYRPHISSANNKTRLNYGEFCRKKEPHFSSVRSVLTVDAPEGRVASVANKLPAIYFSADFERSVVPILRSQIFKSEIPWH